jgi:hypothetical protein
VAEWLLTGTGQPPPLDLGTPEHAATNCLLAQESGSPAFADCFDWEGWFQSTRESVKGMSPAVSLADFDRAVARLGGPEALIAERREETRAFSRGERWVSDAPARSSLPQQLAGLLDAWEQVSSKRSDRVASRNGLKVNLGDAAAIREVLHKGMRIDQVARVKGDLAWLLLTGRNTDGSEYRYSEAWALRDGRWLQRWPATNDDTRLLPAGFPPPLLMGDEGELKLRLNALGIVFPNEERAAHNSKGCCDDAC